LEKKSERLEVRLGYQEKQQFAEACETQGDTPSGAIRRFISGYVRRSDGDILSSAWRGAVKRRGLKAAVFALVFITMGGIFWALAQKYPMLSAEAIFAARDINNDGQLELAEIGIPPRLGGEPSGVMRVLDLDGSETLSRDEFIRQGHMVYALTETQADTEKPVMTLVKFEFEKNRTQSGTYENAVINADEIDRLVLWQADGTTIVFEGGVAIQNEIALTIEADDVHMPK